MRNVEDRLKWFLTHKPVEAGRCAEYNMQALDVPRQGLPDATAVAKVVIAAGNMKQGPCPKGAIRYWTGGSEGHGHVGLEAAPIDAPSSVASVDVNGGGSVGTRPMSWFKSNWPSLKYVGWSWYWGKINTQMEEPPVADWVEGQDKVVQKDNFAVTAGKYAEAARITLGESGSYLLTFQTRLPKGKSGRWQFTRVGWGKDPDGRDETGPNPLTPPDGDATSFTHTHRINGGKNAVVAFEIKVSGTGQVTLPYVICKAERIT